MSLHFPAEKQMEQCIANVPLLTTPYFKNKGITEAISELAKDRLASCDLIEVCAKLGAQDLVNELRKRKFDGEELPEVIWAQVIRATEKAIRDCLAPTKK